MKPDKRKAYTIRQRKKGNKRITLLIPIKYHDLAKRLAERARKR